jgi:hypothetical protein
MTWCPECGCPVAMVTPDEAALVKGCSVRALFRQVEAGHFHVSETAEGLLRVCARSLADRPM